MPEKHKIAKKMHAARSISNVNSDNKAVSDTAIITLESYADCGVPMAREFITTIKALQPLEKSWLAPKGKEANHPEATALLRARYLGGEAALTAFITAGKIHAVIERAAGMYPFGFNTTNNFPVTFIETDISKEFALKPQICAKVANDIGIKSRGHLLFANMDAKTLEGLGTVTRMLRKHESPIAILDAGLMIYQTEAGFEQYVDAGKKLLSLRPNSLWIATDMCFRNVEFVDTITGLVPHMKDYFVMVKEKLSVDYTKFFANKDKQHEFLAQKGLVVEGYSSNDLRYDIRFDGLEKSTLPPAQLQSYLEYLKTNFETLVLRLK